MLITNKKYARSILPIIVIIATVVVLIGILRPVKTLKQYRRIKSNPEIQNAMNAYTFALLDFMNTKRCFPSKEELLTYDTTIGMIDKEISTYGIQINHVLVDSLIYIEMKNPEIGRSIMNQHTLNQNYLSFLFSKTYFWEVFSLTSDSICQQNRWLTLLLAGKRIDDKEAQYRIADFFRIKFEERLQYYAYCHFKLGESQINILCENGIQPNNFELRLQNLLQPLQEEMISINADEIYFGVR